jgi:hypothetical protein
LSKKKSANRFPWGSKKWRETMHRELAQRKRHGENIRDVYGLTDWIEKHGKAKKKA